MKKKDLNKKLDEVIREMNTVIDNPVFGDDDDDEDVSPEEEGILNQIEQSGLQGTLLDLSMRVSALESLFQGSAEIGHGAHLHQPLERTDGL